MAANEVPRWVEYAKLGVAAVTPLVTGIVGLLVLQLGSDIENNKHRNQELIKKRIAFFDDLGPKLNDLLCFYHAIGNWKEINPEKIILIKRDLDKKFFTYKFLLSYDSFAAYMKFNNEYFETFVKPGQDAMLKLDVNFLRERMGKSFQSSWLEPQAMQASQATQGGDAEKQTKIYEFLMQQLAKDIKGDNDNKYSYIHH